MPCRLKTVVFQEQAKPDPAFPTVPFPNPEEGRPVLKLSIETADKNGASIILANDPDADRFQLAEKQSEYDFVGSLSWLLAYKSLLWQSASWFFIFVCISLRFFLFPFIR